MMLLALAPPRRRDCRRPVGISCIHVGQCQWVRGAFYGRTAAASIASGYGGTRHVLNLHDNDSDAEVAPGKIKPVLEGPALSSHVCGGTSMFAPVRAIPAICSACASCVRAAP